MYSYVNEISVMPNGVPIYFSNLTSCLVIPLLSQRSIFVSFSLTFFALLKKTRIHTSIAFLLRLCIRGEYFKRWYVLDSNFWPTKRPRYSRMDGSCNHVRAAVFVVSDKIILIQLKLTGKVTETGTLFKRTPKHALDVAFHYSTVTMAREFRIISLIVMKRIRYNNR